jgi:PEP-CTERM/exosortase A-associated glycosyltransferase
MRILHVLDHSLPVQSGYSFRSHAILRESRKLGLETVHVTSPKHGPITASIETNEFEFHRVTPGAGLLSRLPMVNQLDVVQQLRAKLREVVKATQPDIIQAHSPCLNALAAFDLGPPVVYEMRSSWEDAAVSSGLTHEGSVRYRLSRWLETRALLRADRVTTICEGLRAEAIHRGVAPERVTVIPNAVDADQFSPSTGDGAEVRRSFGLTGKCVLSFIGSFFAWEGLQLLIEALPQVVAARPDIRLFLVGGGPDEAAVKAAVTQLRMSDYVVFAGQVKHDRVAALYEAVDILVYPRTPMRLTNMVTPLKPLEAMALAKVFIASDVGGHRELVRDRETGVLFKAGDKDALARTIIEVAGDAALRARLVANGPRFVRDERTWARSVQNYLPMYRDLLAERGGAALARAPSA